MTDFDIAIVPRYRFAVSDETFPPGPWIGFYTYGGGRDKHRMDLMLNFASGTITGEGTDDIGPFVIRGRFDLKSRECYWTKTYVGGHDVYYRGFRERKGIWGTWEILMDTHGGFHIWPKALGEDAGETETAEEERPVEAVATRALPSLSS